MTQGVGMMLTRCLTNENKDTKFHRETIQKLSLPVYERCGRGFERELLKFELLKKQQFNKRYAALSNFNKKTSP
jgi:hypothetical protein